MDVHNTDIYIVEQVRVELDLIARREKDHYLFFLLLLQKSE
jgi:hypothetical protein